MDQIIRDNDSHNNLRFDVGSMEILESMRRFRVASESQLEGKSREQPKWMIDTIENGR